MLECAIHPITYSEGILATVVKNGYKKNGRWGMPTVLFIINFIRL